MQETRWEQIITHRAVLLPRIDFGDMHHDAGVMMGQILSCREL